TLKQGSLILLLLIARFAFEDTIEPSRAGPGRTSSPKSCLEALASVRGFSFPAIGSNKQIFGAAFPSGEDTRRWRERLHRGAAVYPVEIDGQLFDLVERFAELEDSKTGDRQAVATALGKLLRTHKIAMGDSDLINVRFGSLCRLKSDISRGPRSAI